MNCFSKFKNKNFNFNECKHSDNTDGLDKLRLLELVKEQNRALEAFD